MRVTSEQLSQQLKRPLAPLYTVHGSEPLLALEACDRIRACARAQGYSEREVLTAEAHFDWSQLKNAAQSQSLFATQRLLELRIPSGKPGTEGSSALQDFCEHLPEATVTLIYLNEIDWRAQKSAWFEALAATGIAVEAKQVERKALPAWIAARLSSQEQSANEETLNFIADKVEGNLLAAYQEVQKLALLFPAGPLAFDAVKQAVLDVSRFDVSSLGEVVVSGDARQMARVLGGVKDEGAAAPLVLWTMTEEIRAIGKVLSALAMGRSLRDAMRDARIWGFAHQQLVERRASKYTLPQIEAALLHAARIDRMIKGLASGDVWDELLQLGLRFAKT